MGKHVANWISTLWWIRKSREKKHISFERFWSVPLLWNILLINESEYENCGLILLCLIAMYMGIMRLIRNLNWTNFQNSWLGFNFLLLGYMPFILAHFQIGQRWKHWDWVWIRVVNEHCTYKWKCKFCTYAQAVFRTETFLQCSNGSYVDAYLSDLSINFKWKCPNTQKKTNYMVTLRSIVLNVQ